MTKAVGNYFNRLSARYESGILSNFIWKKIKNKEMAAVQGLLSAQRGEDILDAGSGPGIYAGILSRSGCRVTCVDLSEEMARRARGKNIRALAADMEEFVFKQKFDKIICLGMLEFAASAQKVLINLSGQLKQEGRIIMLVPLKNIPGYYYKVFHLRHGIKVRLFTLREIKGLLGQAGLEIEKTVELFGFCAVIKARPS